MARATDCKQSKLWNIREDFTDVTIVCLDKKTIAAHKIILSSSSQLLHQLCSVSSKISLPKAPLQTVEDLLKFVYTDQVPTDKGRYNEFVVLAKKLEVQGLPAVEPHEDQSNDPLEDQSKDPLVDHTDQPLKANQPNSNKRKRKGLPSVEPLEDQSDEPHEDQSNDPLEDQSNDPLVDQSDQPLKANQSKSNKRKRKSDSKTDPASKHLKKDAKDKSNSTEPTENLIKQTEITDLPNEILLKILSHVQTSDLMKKVSLVSNRFNQLSKDHLAQVSVHWEEQSGNLNIKKFFNGKNRIQEVYVPSTLSQYDLKTFLEHAIVQQKLTTAIYTNSSLGDNAVVDLLARHPEKARQLQKLVLKNRLG
jgi:hypothetical protein